jgi:protein-L-isoaspartate(D-aspartate) O-methyltransferase
VREAFKRGGEDSVKSLRRAPEPPDETCWLAGDGWWLSTKEV